jgi:AAA+ superfamily predicted ATPase
VDGSLNHQLQVARPKTAGTKEAAVARSDLLKQLFAAYSRGDDGEFQAVALKIIADEQRKQHTLLANELRHALNRDRRPGADAPLTMQPLPKGRDDRPLLALSKPQRDLDDLVLTDQTARLLAELIEENRSRSVLASHGLRPRQRLLFVGPSGTGKSASAHALAAQLSLPVATVSLAALTSSYLGETARNVESVVRFAERTACVLLFDEFDSLSAERGVGTDHAEIRRVVATVLQLLDQMHGESILVATSNHPALLDTAVWRRFDEVATFAMLPPRAVAQLIDLKLQAAPGRVSARRWASRLSALSPADVEAVCIQALRHWVLSGAPKLTDEHVTAAAARIEERYAAPLPTDPPQP